MRGGWTHYDPQDLWPYQVGGVLSITWGAASHSSRNSARLSMGRPSIGGWVSPEQARLRQETTSATYSSRQDRADRGRWGRSR